MQASSNDLFQRALQAIPGGVNSPVRAFRSVGGSPFFTRSAQGAYLTTADEQELIDYVCTWGPAINGHNNPAIRSAIAEALEKGTSFGTPNPYEVSMAEKIIEMVPSVEKVRMVNSGTEATMSALRLARGYTGRDRIIKFSGCYHGHVDALLVQAGSGALTLGNPDSAGVPASFAQETIVLPYNDQSALEAIFREQGDSIACIIVEPIPANCGLILPQPGYLEFLREITIQHGSLLIFDEVMTGFRVSPGGVQEHYQVTPDLTALGKIIGGGLPVGAFGGRAEIMDRLAPDGPVYQAGTLSGNPLAMAAGLAALNMLTTQNPYPALQEAGAFIAQALLSASKEKGLPLQVPQIGSMFALFFTESPVHTFDAVMASQRDHFAPLFHKALELGVYLPPSAFETCFISTAHDQSILDRTAEILTQAIYSL